jgi:hypothetical protein
MFGPDLRVYLARALTAVEEWQSEVGRAALTCSRGHRLTSEIHQNSDVILVCPRCRGYSQEMPPEVMAGYYERRSKPVYQPIALKFRTITADGPLIVSGDRGPSNKLVRNDRAASPDADPVAVGDIHGQLPAGPATLVASNRSKGGMTGQHDQFHRLVDRCRERQAARKILKVRTAAVRQVDILYGRQQVGGVHLQPGDLVLLAAQRGEMNKLSDANGIYRVTDDYWTKEPACMAHHSVGDNVQATEGIFRKFVFKLVATETYTHNGADKIRYRYNWDHQAQAEQYLSPKNAVAQLLENLHQNLVGGPPDTEDPPPAA